MATETRRTCDVCERDAEVVPAPWPLTVTDSNGATSDVCSERCLLDLAVELIQSEARESALRIARRITVRRRRWWRP